MKKHLKGNEKCKPKTLYCAPPPEINKRYRKFLEMKKKGNGTLELFYASDTFKNEILSGNKTQSRNPEKNLNHNIGIRWRKNHRLEVREM